MRNRFSLAFLRDDFAALDLLSLESLSMDRAIRLPAPTKRRRAQSSSAGSRRRALKAMLPAIARKLRVRAADARRAH